MDVSEGSPARAKLPAMATRVCPKCGSQYVASVRICIDCDVALIDEVDPAVPEGAPAAPVGDGEQVAYELPGWGNPLKVSLEGMLDRAGIRRAWESGALVVPAEFEEEVDRLVATVEGGEVDELTDDVAQIAFEIEGLGRDELADLDARLIAAHLGHAWDEHGALLVAETDEDEVASLIDQVLHGPAEGDEVDGLAAQQALSALYVAVDKLMKDPGDAKDRDRFLTAAETVGTLPVPYGLSGPDWEQLTGDVDTLADAVRPSGEADETDGDASESESSTDGGDDEADQDGRDNLDETERGGQDVAEETEGPGDEERTEPSVAEQARVLRDRLHEMV